MKHILKPILISLITISFCQAQTLYKSGIDSGGDNVKVGNTKVLFTIGEVHVQELTVGNTYTSEGFISPQDKIDVIITEIMQNPDAVSDANGEYFEVYNPTKLPINLKGWTIKDALADATPHVIASDLIVPADGFVVLARNSVLATNGNVMVDYQYGSTILNNTSDALILEDGENTEIDRTVYDGGPVWPNPTGASMEYVGSNIQDNNDGSLWAAAKSSEGIDAPDLGSPGTSGSNQIVNHLVYENDVWNEEPTPNTGIKNAVVMEGESTIIASDVSVLSLKVREGADATINTGVTLTAPTVTLESSSTSYSSLILDGSIAGTIYYNRHVNINGSGETGSNDLISPPLTGQAFNAFASANPNILNNGTLYLFGPFDKTTGTYLTYTGTDTTPLDAGIGYRAASSDNGTFTFTGTANKSLVSVDIINSGPTEPAEQEWNLVGNPYPSYLNVQTFLTHEVSAGVSNLSLMNSGTAAIYGYDGNALDGWTIYNLATTTASTVIAPGQGFFVSADAINAPLYDLEFTPAMRATGASDDFILGRNNEIVNTHLKLQLSTNNTSKSTDFYFIENTTLGLDRGYDAGVWGTNAGDFSIYSELVEDNTGVDMAIQSLPNEDFESIVIPLGINSNANEQITVSISESNVPASTDVYLEDRLNNTFTLLNQTDFVMTPNENLVGTGRFYLRFADETFGTSENEFDNLKIFATKTPRIITVSGLLTDATEFALFDIRGRLVLTTELDESQLTNQVDVSAFEDGVYIVTLNSAKKTKSQKVILR
ncbi:lamin tail domain-containing protein [Psychroserpens sp.]|uniref:lamin tail domain-containing protein n=1 Tax=Psychroserpens sp. TaxID=2020870 RepID=UPI002B26FB8B|nr:lamin tail domain-containing protein [Psychroserpens sp.]